MTALCRVCVHALPDSAVPVLCCPGCRSWIAEQLTEVMFLWPKLPNHLERGRAHVGPRVSGNTLAGSPMPPAENVLDLIGPGGVHDTLGWHLAAIRAARGMSARPVTGGADYRLRTVVSDLRAHLPWAVQAYDLHALAVELRQLVARMQHATGEGEERDESTKALGRPCPVERITDGGAAVVCGGTLRYDRTARTVRCDDCHRTLDPARWTAAASA